MSEESKTAYYRKLPEAFAETRWTTIVRPSGQGNVEALGMLSRAYWYPLFSFARRQGASEQDAQDQVQDFFVRLLSSEVLASADPGKGRFRSFLLRIFKNFLVSRWRKVANRPPTESLDELHDRLGESGSPAADDPGDADFYRNWSITLLNLALQRLEEEQVALRRDSEFRVLEQHLAGAKDLEALSRQLGIKVGTLKSDLHRLRKRLARLIAEEVRRTLVDPSPEEVEEEMAFIRRYATEGG